MLAGVSEWFSKGGSYRFLDLCYRQFKAVVGKRTQLLAPQPPRQALPSPKLFASLSSAIDGNSFDWRSFELRLLHPVFAKVCIWSILYTISAVILKIPESVVNWNMGTVLKKSFMCTSKILSHLFPTDKSRFIKREKIYHSPLYHSLIPLPSWCNGVMFTFDLRYWNPPHSWLLNLSGGRILGRNRDKSPKSFPPSYSQSALLTDPHPSLEQDYAQDPNEIVRSWIRLHDSKTFCSIEKLLLCTEKAPF